MQPAQEEAAKKLRQVVRELTLETSFKKNVEEFKCIEEVKPDGTIVRKYFDPMASNGNSNPLITTMDKGQLHKEIIYDTGKDLKITYRQLGKEVPVYTMNKGWRFRQTSKYNPRIEARYDSQIYDDGLSHVELQSYKNTVYPRGFKVHIKNSYYQQEGLPSFDKEYLDYFGCSEVADASSYRALQSSKNAQATLDRIKP